MTRLDEAFLAILTTYESKLNDARLSGGLLEDVNTIIRADQTRPKPLTPAVWIFPKPAMQTQKLSLTESWDLPVQLVAIVKEKDPLIGYNKAFMLASRARSVILETRNLGLGYVRDTLSQSFEPGSPVDINKQGKIKNLHANSATIVTRFEVRE